MSKKVLITGITGQDGSYLASELAQKGHEVFGLVRRSSDRILDPRKKKMHHEANVTYVTGNLTDLSSVMRAIETVEPDEIYNLAAQSFVGSSWEIPVETMEVNGVGALNVFEAARQINKDIRIYQASTSELFGKVKEIPQSEATPFHPRSPYGVSKLAGHWAAINYRESYDMHISCGILFNHESPLRGPEFVTRKITLGIARIAHGKETHLTLGNMDAKRDWGHALDYMRAAQLMLEQDTPDDYVISTGETNSVEDFVRTAFAAAGFDKENVLSNYVKQNPKFMRPAEVPVLLGDCTKAKEVLGWEPEYNLDKLVEEMVKLDYDYVERYE